MARGLTVCQMAHPATSPAAGGTDANLFYDRFFRRPKREAISNRSKFKPEIG